MQKDFMFTSESVTEGHPDKLCDQISDAILDRFLQQDPSSALIAALLSRYCDFRLAGILKQFNLRFLPSTVKGGFYRKLAAYGHVGRMDIGLPWEVTDKAPLWRKLHGHGVAPRVLKGT